MGGSTGARTAFYFNPECHDRFIVSVFPFRTASPLLEAFEGLELGEGNLHAQF